MSETGASTDPPPPVPMAKQEVESDIYAGNSGGKVLTTPAVRKIAKENNIDLSLVRGSGPKGRVLKEDVLNFMKSPSTQPAPRAAVAPVAAAPPPPPPTAATSVPSPEPAGVSGQDTVVSLRGVQRIMVKSMTEALAVPHLTYCDEIAMDSLIAVRKELRHNLLRSAEHSKVKMSFMPLIVKVRMG